MEVRTNIAVILRQLAAFKAHVPLAVRSACAPEHWLERAKAVAQEALRAVATPVEAPFVSGFVESVTARALTEQPGFTLRMQGRPQPGRGLDLATLSAGANPAELPLFRAAFFANRDAAYDVILRWVTEGVKDKDGRDKHPDGGLKTDPEIADGIYYILFGRHRGWKVELAAQSLLKTDAESPRPDGRQHLVDFAAGEAGRNGLSAARASEWLQIVLATWRVVIRAELPQRVRAKIAKFRKGRSAI